jgi:hypothetical protein
MFFTFGLNSNLNSQIIMENFGGTQSETVFGKVVSRLQGEISRTGELSKDFSKILIRIYGEKEMESNPVSKFTGTDSLIKKIEVMVDYLEKHNNVLSNFVGRFNEIV